MLCLKFIAVAVAARGTIVRVAVGFVWMIFAFSATSAQAAPTARTVYLIRHGDYDVGAAGVGKDGPDLTALGVAQARLTGARLSGLQLPGTHLVTSTMSRAAETAGTINQSLIQLTLEYEPLLRECTPPGRSHDEGEEGVACQMQLDAAFSKYFAPASSDHDKNYVLVCHGNVIRYFVMRALGVDTRAWSNLRVAHASVTTIRIEPNGRVVVSTVGDVGHIPSDLQSDGAEPSHALVPIHAGQDFATGR